MDQQESRMQEWIVDEKELFDSEIKPAGTLECLRVGYRVQRKWWWPEVILKRRERMNK